MTDNADDLTVVVVQLWQKGADLPYSIAGTTTTTAPDVLISETPIKMSEDCPAAMAKVQLNNNQYIIVREP